MMGVYGRSMILSQELSRSSSMPYDLRTCLDIYNPTLSSDSFIIGMNVKRLEVSAVYLQSRTPAHAFYQNSAYCNSILIMVVLNTPCRRTEASPWLESLRNSEDSAG